MELILDCAGWRSGSDGPNRLGTGPTRLLNDDGFKCCLGQFATQCIDGVTDTDIEGIIDPESLFLIGRGLATTKDRVLVQPVNEGNSNLNIYHYVNSHFAKRAMRINDNVTTTGREKIDLLTQLCEEYGHTLKVINEHALDVEVA